MTSKSYSCLCHQLLQTQAFIFYHACLFKVLVYGLYTQYMALMEVQERRLSFKQHRYHFCGSLTHVWLRSTQLRHVQKMEVLVWLSLNYIPLLRSKAVWKHIQEAGVKRRLYFVQGCGLCRGHHPPLTPCYISESLEHGGDTKTHLEAEWCHLQPLPFCWQAWFCSLSPRNADFSKSSSWMRTLWTE